MQVSSPETARAGGALESTAPRRALAGFFVSGVLLSFLGAILPAWRHHLSSDYTTVGLYFAGLIAGLLGSVAASGKLLERKGTAWTLALACGIAGCGFLFLAFASPPASPWWRVGGMAVIGFAAGLLHTAMFQAISPVYRHDPVATVNLAGLLFGLGCLTVALLISGAFYAYTAAALQAWIAAIPALFGWICVKTKFPAAKPRPAGDENRSSAPLLAELRSPAAVLLALLLFFQLGNEWAIAGWLPLFLIQRLGISPVSSLMMLATYWLALLIGRAAAQWVLPRIRHSRLLAGSVLASILGCTILAATNNRFGAATGILLLGGAFAPIYPLVVEKIGSRFPNFHPGFYNGVFSLAMAGGLLAPCFLGYLASQWGVRVVMGVPMAGSMVVFALLVLIWIEARITTPAQSATAA
ncbi:MAG TPA: MFS transporter [Bryobacteraceae bacterium]|nr:MFS transporter [Bryobacteraceae bacterium]